MLSNKKLVDPLVELGKDFGKDLLNFFVEAFIGTKIEFPEAKRNRMEVIFESCGLKTTIKKESENTYSVDVPLGKTLRDFEKAAEAIATALGKNVEISFRLIGESKLRMSINNEILEDQYDFEPITLRNPAEILIGHSRRGIVSVDLTKYPNMLIAGATGSGKSTYLVQLILNTILTSKSIVLHLVDLKSGIEFHNFERSSIVESYATDVSGAEEIINKLEQIMAKRQQILAEAGVVKLEDYNDRFAQKKLKYHLVIVDEFANLREEKALKKVFDKLLRQGRNAGIFFVLSTQRPTVDTIPGNFSANIQCRLAFHTATERESEIILGYGRQDAARLNVIGRGIFQAYETATVQPMYIKNDDRVILPLIKNTLVSKPRQEELIKNSNRTGMVKC